MDDSAPLLARLDYAPLPSARRRWARRLLRRWPVGLVLLVSVVSIVYGPSTWRHWKLLRLQEACMMAELPGDRVMCESDRVAVKRWPTAWVKEYNVNTDAAAVRVDSRWVDLVGTGRVLSSIYLPPGPLQATTFLHERYTTDGRRRLVVVEQCEWVTIIEPGGWLGAQPHTVRRERIQCDEVSRAALDAANGLSYSNRIYAGIADASDPSRFTVSFVDRGVTGTWAYQLRNDERVTMRLLDPQGFIARATAAKRARRTSP